MAPGAATGIVKLGQALAEWTDTAEALKLGRISTAHAKVIVGFFAHLPDGVPPEALPECERYLLDAAVTDNPVELARRAAALHHLLEPVEGSVPDAENVELNELHAATTLGGRGMVRANVDAETMEMLLTALSALSAPRPGLDGSADRRSAGRRQADAFTELLRRYLNSGGSPVEGYERPHLSLLIHAADLASDDATQDTATDVGSPAAESEQPPRPAPDRGAYEAMFGPRAGAPGWMPWLGPISAASARRIACDCELTAILLDDDGIPLNLGRSQRLVSPQQRRALIARDHGCAFPGCGRRPKRTISAIGSTADNRFSELGPLVHSAPSRHPPQRLGHRDGHRRTPLVPPTRMAGPAPTTPAGPPPAKPPTPHRRISTDGEPGRHNRPDGRAPLAGRRGGSADSRCLDRAHDAEQVAARRPAIRVASSQPEQHPQEVRAVNWVAKASHRS